MRLTDIQIKLVEEQRAVLSYQPLYDELWIGGFLFFDNPGFVRSENSSGNALGQIRNYLSFWEENGPFLKKA